MENHPIESLMLTAMSSIESMVDVNTIIGEPIEAPNNIVIIPISKVCFGFAAGGSEFKGETFDESTKKNRDEKVQYRLPFGGGSGAGVSINPIGFLVVEEGKVRLLPINHTSCIDKLLDYVPDLFEKIAQAKNKFSYSEDNKEYTECKEEKTDNRIKDNIAYINKIPKTSEEKLEYKPKVKRKEENEEISEELEELFEEEYEYQDDD